MKIQKLNEWGSKWNYNNLHGTKWETISKSKNPPSFAMWQAAQLAVPDEKTHGRLGACQIIEADGHARYLKQFYINGYYEDGTHFELGPMKRDVASEYLSMHRLSINNREWDDLVASDFHGIKILNGSYPKGYITIIKMPDGFWLKDIDSKFRVGPFTSKQIAKNYAHYQKYDFGPSTKRDKTSSVDHLVYPTFAFEYKMRGIPCADIVVAENIQSAMKLFDFQWHIFDNTRPTRAKFNTIDELKRSLSIMRITDIDITELDSENLNTYVEMVNDIGNPSTNPQLKRFNRNPRFKYILGIDMKTGRSPVTINW